MIHPTALVHRDARVDASASIGPWCLVEAGAEVGAHCALGPFSRVLAGAVLEEGVILDGGAVIGGVPQDQKYAGGPTRARIGAGTRIGEYATVNRAAVEDGETRVGANALVMAYAHVAHDCEIGDRAVIANAVQLGGHVWVGEGAILSGMTGVHQFTCVGAGAFVGGGLRVDRDVPPFCKALGDPLRWGGLNLTGLRRDAAKMQDADAPAFLDAFYRRAYAGSSGCATALEWMEGQAGHAEIRDALREFFARRRRALLPRDRPRDRARA